MNSIIEKQLKRLDANGDGKITIADAHDFVATQLAKRDPLRVGTICYVAGIISALLIVYVAR